jgi:hypothetical protein
MSYILLSFVHSQRTRSGRSQRRLASAGQIGIPDADEQEARPFGSTRTTPALVTSDHGADRRRGHHHCRGGHRLGRGPVVAGLWWLGALIRKARTCRGNPRGAGFIWSIAAAWLN